MAKGLQQKFGLAVKVELQPEKLARLVVNSHQLFFPFKKFFFSLRYTVYIAMYFITSSSELISSMEDKDTFFPEDS